ncbi:MAG: nuclear transport factor 2 family protein [Terracoccus sp.]
MTTVTDAGPESEHARVWHVLTDLYAAYLEGDRPRLEDHLDVGCTMWDSTIPGLRTKEDLQSGRGAGDSDPDYPSPIGLEATDPVVGLLSEDAAWETHLLTARFEDRSLDEQLRCTSVLRRDAGGTWRVVHHHEEMLTGPGRSAPVRRLPSA